MRHEKFTPLFMNRRAVRKQSQSLLKEPSLAIRFLGRKTVAIAIQRAGTRIPKFSDILGRVAEGHRLHPKNCINRRNL